MSSIPPYPGSDSAGRPEDGSSANPSAWSAPQQAQGSPAQYGQASPYGQPGQQDPQGQPGQPGTQDQPGQQFPAGPQTQPAAASDPAPGTDLGSDLGSSVSWMWSAFARNVAAFLVPAIIWSVAVFVIVGVAVTIAIIVMFGMMQDAPTSSDEVPVGAMVALYGITLASVPFAWIIALLWQSGAVRAAETVRTGGRPVLGRSFVGPGRVILTALLVGIMVGIGTLILVIPGLVLGVFSFYALPAAARGASPVQAIKESFSLVKNNFGLTVLAYVITMAASSIAGSIVIGSILLLPLLVLFQFGLYERVNGRRLTEPVRA
ncbi:hypothetical protein Bra3105_15050 [Brachybacterium halotolerans subsp. kimchii]|uniref:hypothetical protein n=1 Tax=Brachybacterium halotolerans TaxID=2795215 RepID=UPI001E5FA042|nr:hypothetical protein [Brachybacterium halotolerans]UEJ82143.1 hypothetical protein Bra3105_15050 [Brachybacterium halotolerans subsp. kimchii]